MQNCLTIGRGEDPGDCFDSSRMYVIHLLPRELGWVSQPIDRRRWSGRRIFLHSEISEWGSPEFATSIFNTLCFLSIHLCSVRCCFSKLPWFFLSLSYYNNVYHNKCFSIIHSQSVFSFPRPTSGDGGVPASFNIDNFPSYIYIFIYIYIVLYIIYI